MKEKPTGTLPKNNPPKSKKNVDFDSQAALIVVHNNISMKNTPITNLDFVPTEKKRIPYVEADASSFVSPAIIPPPFSFAIAKEVTNITTITSDGKETTNTAMPGDFLLSGPSSEIYVVTPKNLAKLYEFRENPKTGDISIIPQPGKREVCRYEGEPTSIPAPWGGDPMPVLKGDYLVNGADGIYRVAAKEFADTYYTPEEYKVKEDFGEFVDKLEMEGKFVSGVAVGETGRLNTRELNENAMAVSILRTVDKIEGANGANLLLGMVSEVREKGPCALAFAGNRSITENSKFASEAKADMLEAVAVFPKKIGRELSSETPEPQLTEARNNPQLRRSIPTETNSGLGLYGMAVAAAVLEDKNAMAQTEGKPYILNGLAEKLSDAWAVRRMVADAHSTTDTKFDHMGGGAVATEKPENAKGILARLVRAMAAQPGFNQKHLDQIKTGCGGMDDLYTVISLAESTLNDKQPVFCVSQRPQPVPIEPVGEKSVGNMFGESGVHKKEHPKSTTHGESH